MRDTITAKNHEGGFASIVIALVMIVVLALLTIGFAQLARREQSNALDKQLSNQAYYAAESGVNHVYKQLRDGSTTLPDATHSHKDTCLSDLELGGDGSGKASVILPAANNVQFSCVLYDPEPSELIYTGVETAQGRYSVFTPTSPLSAGLRIDWKSHSNNTGLKNITDKFSPNTSWGAGNMGVIQFSITPLDNLTRTALTDSTYTVYMYPTVTAGVSVYAQSSNAANAPVVGGGCSAAGDYRCGVTITGLPASTSYLAHFVSYYDSSDVRISDPTVGPTAAKFADSQAVIDVTGKAKDVLKRLQVRVPIIGSGSAGGIESGIAPDYALEVGNACKRLQTEPTKNSYVAPPGFTACDSQSANINN
jgi:hypothetical protein